MKVDLSGVEAWKAGGPPPPGSHLCRIDDAKEGESSGGYPQLELSWTVTSGQYEGAEIRDWLTIVEATRGKLVALLQAVGIDVPAGEFDFKVDDAIGRQAVVVTRLEPKYNDPDKMVTRVAGYKPASEHALATAAAGSNGGGAATPDSDLPF